MASDMDRGRTHFLLVVGAMMLELLLLSLGVWLRVGELHPLTDLGRPLIFVLLAVLAYRGASWARKLLAAWSAILAIVFGVVAINSGFTSVVWTLVALGFAGGAVYAAVVLFTSDDVEAFLTQQRTSRESPRRAE